MFLFLCTFYSIRSSKNLFSFIYAPLHDTYVIRSIYKYFITKLDTNFQALSLGSLFKDKILYLLKYMLDSVIKKVKLRRCLDQNTSFNCLSCLLAPQYSEESSSTTVLSLVRRFFLPNTPKRKTLKRKTNF